MKNIYLFTAAAFLTLSAGASMASAPAVNPLTKLAKIGTVDARYQSYNVEMVEITGGRFWAPYGGPAGELHRMRPPLDLSAARIRALAKPLGPVYMRVSGTWANSTYLPLEGEKLSGIPDGFKQVLTRDQWRGVINFAKAVDAKIVTSFPSSEGARDPDGKWNPDQAQRLINLTREAGGNIYGAELFNEPSVPPFGGFPKGYNAADFTRDFRIFRDWAHTAAPKMKLTGPGGASEGTMLKHTPETESRGFLNSEDLIKDNANSLDIFSYHFYGAGSIRCGASATGSKETALSPQWLDMTLIDQAHYAALRDRYAPGKPLWLNETAQAACGGSPWASTFLDSFRYLNQLGALAQKGVKVVAHNTLAASDYALIDYDTMMPRPNYWAAVLWHRIMGQTVLASPVSPSTELRLYAQCLPERKGGVGLLAINIGGAAQKYTIAGSAKIWAMTATPLDSKEVMINGKAPTMDNKGILHGVDGKAASGSITLAPQSITFIADAKAHNRACT